ncbi:4081_t:CDS:2 [Dentiscutata erythropus]|uniref:4081_t:CDS:1 n=1 Tax=Dentiscutata erythropus TaxID=1348616 RepID=A0A9N8W354_9GLOM|nr:4081_t:CDS:2 [Dentiscutata erythropus]
MIILDEHKHGTSLMDMNRTNMIKKENHKYDEEDDDGIFCGDPLLIIEYNNAGLFSRDITEDQDYDNYHKSLFGYFR